MNEVFHTEGYVFILCLLSGLYTGALFDSFKIVRNLFTNSFMKNLCDALFWIFYAVFFVWWIFRINDGELRWYIFTGIMLGATFYFLLLSKVYVFLGTLAVTAVVKLIELIIKISLWPVVFILKKSHSIFIMVIRPLKKLKRKTVLLNRFLSVKAKNRNFFYKKVRILEKNTLQ